MKSYLKEWLLIAALAICSHSNAQTTQEEYNYITKGYKVQLESGLDMKKGYYFEDLGNWSTKLSNEVRNCEFKALFKEGEDIPTAHLLIYNRTDIPDGAKYFICIPSADAPQELWNQTMVFIKENCAGNEAMMITMIWSLMHLTSTLNSNEN